MTRATATIDTGSRNSYPCHQPIRGQDGGPWTNQRPANSFPWPGPDHRSQTTDLFWSPETANHDNILSLWLSHYLRLSCVSVAVVSLYPVTASITLSNEVITAICGPITQQFLLFLQRSEISFLTSRFQSKYVIGVRQSFAICYTLLLLWSLFLNIMIMFSSSVESLGKSEQRSCDKKIIMPLAVKKWPWKWESHNLLIAERWAGDASENWGRSLSHPSGCIRHVWMTPQISKFQDEIGEYQRCSLEKIKSHFVYHES